jgi:hypothetical protein
VAGPDDDDDSGIEEDEAATGVEEHAAAGGLPILPRMVYGKQRTGAMRACLEVGKGKYSGSASTRISSIFLCYSYCTTNLILASFDVHVQLSLFVSSGDLLEQGLLMRWVRLLLLVGKKGSLF